MQTTAVKSEPIVIDGVIWIHPNRQGGEPCFYGTRVPIKILFDYLAGGDPLDEFLEGFPPITREQAEKVLELAKTHFIKRKTHIEMIDEVNQVLLSIQPGQVIEVFHADMKP